MRATALRLPEAAGPRVGQIGEGEPALRLLIVGDSSAAGVGAAHQHEALSMQLARALADRLGAPVAWQLVARSGHRSEQALAELEQAPIAPADVLVTALGVNDVIDQQAPALSVQALDRIHGLARERAGVRLSLHCAVPPMHAFPLLPQPLRWFFGQQAGRLNRTLEEALRSQPARQLVQLPEDMRRHAPTLIAEDGFHPNAEGYRRWAQVLAELIVVQPVAKGRGLPCRSMAT